MNARTPRRLVIFTCILTLAVCLAGIGGPHAASAQTIVDEWNAVKAPPAPELKRVTIDPKGSALLVLDVLKQNCPPRPRCIASLPKIQGLLAQARGKGMMVIYGYFPGANAGDILPEVAPQAGEPIIMAMPDKFIGTDLERMLKDKGIQTVILVGVAAHGVVLHTASGAAFRGFKVIVPVDGMSSENTYAEQYTTWHLANAPRVGPQVILTRMDMIQYP